MLTNFLRDNKRVMTAIPILFALDMTVGLRLLFSSLIAVSTTSSGVCVMDFGGILLSVPPDRR
jgi:hypothetical protein